jgi:hypothetical protein
MKIKLTEKSVPIITKKLISAIEDYQSHVNYSLATRTGNVTDVKIAELLREVKTGCKLLDISLETAMEMYETAQSAKEQP